ncbi:carboxypeptidase regulatory-like domain-containing protein [Aquimarina aggregata]|uniref:carboxypeptidase regulatory-like domain-containing protein n=1 Tax=Aquimarina aggregata TaxID=1642818 RepID=UPI002490ECB6|nr:carboxypeptidase regulatory-like domain-containing protein [Aquimarina aggregata]
MTRFFYSLLCISIFCSGWSQNASVKGNVIDSKTREPVADALVMIEGTETLQKTNVLGEFLLDENVPIDKIAITITKDGYKLRRFKVQIVENKAATIKDINLFLEKPGASKKGKKEKITFSGTALTGIITDRQSGEVISEARVSIVGTFKTTKTDSEGRFAFASNVPPGPRLIEVSKDGYGSKTYDVFIANGKVANIDGITLGNDIYDIENLQINTFSEDQLLAENEGIRNGSRFYQSSNDIFLKTAAYQFSSSFFNVRGQDASSGEVLINGVSYNNVFDGAPEWNTLGGLEEVTQNTMLNYGLTASKYAIGGTLGSLNINTRASQYRKGGKLSYFSSNRRFSHGVNATYATGMTEKGYAIAVSATKRTAFDEGYFDGTPYDSNSFFISAENKIDGSNTINFTAFFTPTERSGRSANTREVFGLKGNRYNSFWGLQSGEIRNARKQNVSQPLLMLSHYLNAGTNLKLSTNLAYSFGTKRRSRIDFQGANINNTGAIIPSPGINPDPTLISRLPSFFLLDADNPDFEGAFTARENFQNDGQIDWFNLFDTNRNSGLENAIYALYEDVQKQSNLTINTIANITVNQELTINGTLRYSRHTLNNFAEIKSLLGGQGYLDVNTAEGTGNSIQSDLQNINRIVREDDEFRYNYDLNKSTFQSFVQGVYKTEQFSGFLGVDVSYSKNQREGKFQNGASPNLSLGPGENYNFLDLGVKGGLTYKINPIQKVSLSGLYTSNAPELNTIFLNARESDNPRMLQGSIANNDLVIGSELIDINKANTIAIEGRYEFNNSFLKANVSAFYTTVSDASTNNLFEGNTINTTSSSSIQEVLTGIDTRSMGVEVGILYKILQTLSVKGAVAIGDYTYTNNPQLQYVISETNVVDLGETFLEGLNFSNGPSNVYSLGFEYRAPDQWWFDATANYFSNQYIAINPYFRTQDFFLDTDGIVFENFDTESAKSLLKQQQLDDYLMINLSGGKNWDINDNGTYIGFKLGINNILGENHDIRGYEPTGQLKYNTRLEDSQRERPIYGNRFWKGYGATYFANIYFRF